MAWSSTKPGNGSILTVFPLNGTWTSAAPERPAKRSRRKMRRQKSPRRRGGWAGSRISDLDIGAGGARPLRQLLRSRERIFGRLRECGLQLLGRPYEVEVFEKTRPDARCGACGGWGHIEARCGRDARCALCAEKHHTDKHKCPVEGCFVVKGQACAHVVAKCPNCRDPRTAQPKLCPKTKEAREAGRGWRSPPPLSRRGERAPAASPPPGSYMASHTTSRPAETPDLRPPHGKCSRRSWDQTPHVNILSPANRRANRKVESDDRSLPSATCGLGPGRLGRHDSCGRVRA